MFDTDDDESLEEKIDAITYAQLLLDEDVVILDARAAALALIDKQMLYLRTAAIVLPDPPLKELVSSFELEAMHNLDAAPITYPSVDASVAGAPGGAGDPPADPDQPGLGGFGAAALPKDVVHVSDAAMIFKDWHIKTFPSGSYSSPYSVPIEDESIVAAIKKARSMLPVIPHGEKGVAKPQPSGTMGWLKFPNGGKTYEGWIYVEPAGDYQDWFWARIHELYNALSVEADKVTADPTVSASTKMGARSKQRNLSAVAAVMRQEGLPPAINTYDGQILTGGSGLSAPGYLNAIWNALAKDPNCVKVMYLCGFRFDGNAVDGEFQIADVESEVPRVYHQSNFATEDVLDGDTGRKKYLRGTRTRRAHQVLSHFTDQLDLLVMLITLARDELTRARFFNANLITVAGLCRVAGAENIATEALYVFVGEVQHNWNLTERKVFTAAIKAKVHRPSNLVQWAIAHFTADERRLALPSEDGDRAIAKGVFRFVLRCLQEDAFNSAKRQLEDTCRAKKTKMLEEADAPLLSTFGFMYGFNRLLDSYWTPMKTGVGPARHAPHSIDGSTLAVPNFPQTVPSRAAAAPSDQVVQDVPGSKAIYYVIGTRAQCDFIVPSDVRLFGFDATGHTVVEDTVTKERWSMQQDPTTEQWSRVP